MRSDYRNTCGLWKCGYGVAIAAILVIMGCRGEPKSPEIRTAPSHQSNVASADLSLTTERSVVAFKEREWDALYLRYLDLKAALINSDVKGAQQQAVLLDRAIQHVAAKANQNKDSKAKDILTAAAVSVKEIVEGVGLDDQRKSFLILSKSLEKPFDNYLNSGSIYKQFCPMAFDGKGGYWFSDSPEIRNPFYGARMLKCGVVKKIFQ